MRSPNCSTIKAGELDVEALTASDYDRAGELMRTYADLEVGRIDLVEFDARRVGPWQAICENRSIRRHRRQKGRNRARATVGATVRHRFCTESAPQAVLAAA
jgi:hypothetical protein